MSPTHFVPARQDSSANERAIPVVPEPPNRHVFYPYPEVSYASYRIIPGPSFDLKLERGDGYWTVRDVETGIYGDAEDVLGALQDFYRAAEQHLSVLERQDALSKELSWQLEYLRVRIRH